MDPACQYVACSGDFSADTRVSRLEYVEAIIPVKRTARNTTTIKVPISLGDDDMVPVVYRQ
jgi:hypothetical protein